MIDFLYDWDEVDPHQYGEEDEVEYQQMKEQEPQEEHQYRLSMLKKKYRRQYFRELFDGVTPVFVSACINRAVTTVIVAIINNNTSDAIAINFVYSLFVAHACAYYIAIRVSPKWNLFPYFFRLSIENAGFAWLSTLTLIILKWLYRRGNPIFSFVAWIVLVIIVLLLIVAYCFFEVHYLKPTPAISKKLRIFMSDVFALPIAYTLAVIIASVIYQDSSSSYLSGSDDDASVDDQVNAKSVGGNCFILFAAGVTTLVFMCQRKFNFYQVEEDEEDQNLADNTVDGVDLPTENCDDTKTRSRWVNCLVNDDLSGMPVVRPVRLTIKNLVGTTVGYFMGCTWYLWSVLTFQRLFNFIPNGEVLGLALYCFAITAVVLNILAYVATVETERSFRLSIGDMHEPSKLIGCENSFCCRLPPSRDYVDGQMNLMFSSGRLVVGWSWQEFVTSCFSAMVGSYSRQSIEGVWTGAIVKVVVAAIVAVIGAYVELWRQRKRNQSTFQKQSAKDNEMINRESKLSQLESIKRNEAKI